MSNENNYELKSEAVETLAGADSSPTPEYSKEELERYKGKKKFKIPAPVKILFLKAWFAGAVCFFFLWGLGLTNLLDTLFVLGVAIGLVTDLLVNNVIRFLEAFPGEREEWMLFPKKGMVSFFLNLIYGFVIAFCVYLLYSLINFAIMSLTGNTETLPLGVEPVLFGIFCMGIDMLFVGIKRLIVNIIEDAQYAAGKR